MHHHELKPYRWDFCSKDAFPSGPPHIVPTPRLLFLLSYCWNSKLKNRRVVGNSLPLLMGWMSCSVQSNCLSSLTSHTFTAGHGICSASVLQLWQMLIPFFCSKLTLFSFPYCLLYQHIGFGHFGDPLHEALLLIPLNPLLFELKYAFQGRPSDVEEAGEVALYLNLNIWFPSISKGRQLTCCSSSPENKVGVTLLRWLQENN